MFTSGSPLRLLLDAPVRPGRVAWIGARPARRAPLRAADEVALDPDCGVAGDHARPGKRQVTLIDAASLAAIASYLGRGEIDPAALRRNIVVAGINLHGLAGAILRVGDAGLLVTGDCHPCSRMEEAFGLGGYNAVRGHGGVTARILSAGTVRLGDAVERVAPSPPAPPPHSSMPGAGSASGGVR